MLKKMKKCVVPLEPSPMQTNARSISTISINTNERARTLKCVAPLEMP
jgi:hypothetical protein